MAAPSCSVARLARHASALRLMQTLAGLLLVALVLPGCDLIFEPSDTAAARLMKATHNRDKRTIAEFFDNKALENKMYALAGHMDGPRFDGYDDVWYIDGEPEEDESNGYTYVWVIINVPPSRRSNLSSPSTTDIVLEMERSWLRWTVHDVQGLDELLTLIERTE